MKSELASFEAQVHQRITIESLGEDKDVEDSPTKMLIRGADGTPLSVLFYSRIEAPDMAWRTVRKAEAVRALIGEDLGEAIIQTLASGYVEGRSYAIMPFQNDLSSKRIARFFQKRRLRRPLLGWLRESVAAAAASNGRRAGGAEDYVQKLQRLGRTEGIDASIRDAIDKSLDRIGSGKWKPCHSFDHNDLWQGNVMLPERGKRAASASRFPFVIIDWAGANPKGYGMVDLLSFASSFAISKPEFEREVRLHCQALGCEPEDARGHLLACFGNACENLGHFPVDAFLGAVDKFWIKLTSVV